MKTQTKYLFFISAKHELFQLSLNLKQKILNDENYAEIHNQIMNLSTRIKDFDTKTPQKLLCSLNMSKLLLKLFNAFNELNSNVQSDHENEDDELEEKGSELKILTKSIVENAVHLTDSVPDIDLFRTMMLKKFNYSKMVLKSKGRH